MAACNMLHPVHTNIVLDATAVTWWTLMALDLPHAGLCTAQHLHQPTCLYQCANSKLLFLQALFPMRFGCDDGIVCVAQVCPCLHWIKSTCLHQSLFRLYSVGCVPLQCSCTPWCCTNQHLWFVCMLSDPTHRNQSHSALPWLLQCSFAT